MYEVCAKSRCGVQIIALLDIVLIKVPRDRSAKAVLIQANC